MLYIQLTDQISLSCCLYFLRYWAIYIILIIRFPGCDVMNFEINLSFPIKLFSCMTKKPEQEFKYLQNEKSFLVKKTCFIIFKGLSATQDFLRPKSACLILSWQRSLSYRNQSIDLISKSMDSFLFHRELLHEELKFTISRDF